MVQNALLNLMSLKPVPKSRREDEELAERKSRRVFPGRIALSDSTSGHCSIAGFHCLRFGSKGIFPRTDQAAVQQQERYLIEYFPRELRYAYDVKLLLL